MTTAPGAEGSYERGYGDAKTAEEFELSCQLNLANAKVARLNKQLRDAHGAIAALVKLNGGSVRIPYALLAQDFEINTQEDVLNSELRIRVD